MDKFISPKRTTPRCIADNTGNQVLSYILQILDTKQRSTLPSFLVHFGFLLVQLGSYERCSIQMPKLILK